MVQVSDNLIWVGTNGGGISVFDLKGNFVKSIKDVKKNVKNATNKLINALFQDKQNNTWIGTVESGLMRYQPSNDSFYYYKFGI